VTKANDPKPIRDLVLEFKAEVVEEVTVDDDSEVTTYIITLTLTYRIGRNTPGNQL